MKSRLILLAFLFCHSVYSQVADLKMVLIPAGEFTMGKNSSGTTDWQPEHKVSVDAFYMDKCEVTNKEYYEFCAQTGNPLPEFWGSLQFKCSLEYPDYPVVGVSFNDAIKYAQWAGKRLPTEAEWEYAARGGLPNSNYPWGNRIDSTLVNYGKKYKTTVEVGSFIPNGYGLFDMGGNVWEWTMDNYEDNYYTNSPSQNPKGPISGRFKVIRGGSWHSGAMCIQTFYRNGLPASWVDFAVGFRCVKNAR
jgi:sulfatase modifying factor 1